MQRKEKRVVVLGTGGTIAGESAAPDRPGQYVAATLSIESLVAAIPQLAVAVLELEQPSQIDSKDMSFALWRTLAERVAHHVSDPEVAGIVITHGTDTLEETAYFLHRVLAPPKPVVLTGAMRPATALSADGPQNFLDAITVAQTAGARGVVAVIAGHVIGGADVRKMHTHRLDAFTAGGHGPIALMRSGHVQQLRDWPDGGAVGIDALPRENDEWPWVEIVMNSAGTSGAAVRALVRAGVRGIVAAGTGNGTLHVDLLSALLEAQGNGVAILRCSRCAEGGVTELVDDRFKSQAAAGNDLTAVQARVELMLRLMMEQDAESRP